MAETDTNNYVDRVINFLLVNEGEEEPKGANW